MNEEQIIKFEKFTQQCMKDHQAVGMAVALVDKEGATLYEEFFGEKKKDTNTALNGETIFGLASLTKSFTCLAILKMQEEGILSIDDPVSKYIPAYKGMNGGQPLCIKHFMCHSGGYFPQSRIVVDDVVADMGLDKAATGDLAYNAELESEGLKRVAGRLDAQTEFIGKPGEYFSYCNDGYGLLSDIIYRHGGEGSFADYLLEHILKPLNMQRSFCDFDRPLRDENHASLYNVIDGVLTDVKDYRDNAFVLNGGGAMKSTLNDLKKYIAMYLKGGKSLEGVSLAGAASIKSMTTPHQKDTYISDYGYGLSIKNLGGITVAGHGGSLPGVSSHILWSVDKGIGAIILCNTEDVPVSGIAEALLKMGLGLEAESERHHFKNTPWNPELLDAACGVYASGEGTKVELCKNEKGEAMVKNGTKTYALTMIEEAQAMIANDYSDTYIRMISDDARGIFAMGYGSRILPRQK